MSRLPFISRQRLGLGLLSSLLLFPLLVLLWVSLVEQWAYPQLWDSQFTASHWRGMLSGRGRDIGSSLWKSLLFSSTIAFLSTAMGFVCSWAIKYHPRQGALLSFAYYPYLIAPVILGTMMQYYFLRLGLLGSWAGIGLAQLLFVFPYAVIFFSGFWTAEVKALQGQSLTLGASPRQYFLRLLLPLARPWISVCLFQCFLISWFEYGITQLIGVGQLPTLTIKVVQLVKEANPYLAAVASCLMMSPPLLLLAINRRLLLRQ